MSQRTIITEERGRAEMRVLVDSGETDALNAEERLALGRGFTAGGTMRKIANIDGAEYNALLRNMDKDALDLEAGDRRALYRLLRRFPAWRCSEGGV